MSLAVWACARDVPIYVCSDARLTDRSRINIISRSVTGTDQDHGQANWQVGINFVDLADLVAQLRSFQVPEHVSGGGRQVRRGQITRLAINAHGNWGEVFINGQTHTPTLTADSLRALHEQLHQIGLMTPNSRDNPAVILLVGCVAGTGEPGNRLLRGLSRLWPNRKVVGFTTIGFSHGGEMSRSGDGCTEPGMRDTHATSPGEADRSAGRYWTDRRAWPWASETSPHAKVALNDRIISGGQL